ncbi:hypothetical protein LTR53_000607 [Teratosphaeriaceae sp. CCFEE 6253]|nr:hypothetical protein LTR53_000607 [Teratosphaeriaceae sp. CCFEE 6253]
MPPIYHLRPTSETDLGIMTPPTSPLRSFSSPYAKLTEADLALAGAICNCGHQMFDGRGCCPACSHRQRKRHYQLSGREPSLPMTPPPSQLSTPRQSLDMARPTFTPQLDIAGPLSPAPPAPPALHSDVLVDGGRGLANPSPAQMHRGALAIGASPVRPEATAISQHSGVSRETVARHTRPSTLSRGTSGLGLQDYSPMAASFARMSRKEVRTERLIDERRLSQHCSLDLAARMFDGPA